MTHQGRIIGCDARTPDGYSRLVNLRQTKTLWIDGNGSRWSKKNGYPSPVRRLPPYRLDLTTVAELS
jgi:hypothetical protein